MNRTPSAALRRYQLTVVAANMADVVGSAGGWLCDRARAGWDVNVLVADHQDARPLSILGATALDVDGALSDAVKQAVARRELAISAHRPGRRRTGPRAMCSRS